MEIRKCLNLVKKDSKNNLNKVEQVVSKHRCNQKYKVGEN